MFWVCLLSRQPAPKWGEFSAQTSSSHPVVVVFLRHVRPQRCWAFCACGTWLFPSGPANRLKWHTALQQASGGGHAPASCNACRQAGRCRVAADRPAPFGRPSARPTARGPGCCRSRWLASRRPQLACAAAALPSFWGRAACDVTCRGRWAGSAISGGALAPIRQEKAFVCVHMFCPRKTRLRW